MADDELELTELVRKASSRAASPKKSLSLVTSWLSARDLSDQEAQDILANALLSRLTAPHPPANIFNYISQSLATSALSARTLAIHLLFFTYDGRPLSNMAIVSIAGVIMANLTGLEPGQALASSLERPIAPDIGTSSDASQATPTLALLLPLLRQCASPSASPTVVGLVERLLTLLNSHPAPPLDVGLEAGSLLQLLPEQLVVRLRECLSGLMADLSDQQQPTSSQTMVENGLPSAQINASTGAQSDLPTPIIPSGPLPLPLPRTLNFLLIHAITASKWTPSPDFTSKPPRPPENQLALVRLGPRIASDPSFFLLHLIQACVTSHNGEYIGNTYRGAQRWIFMTEHLPALLRWWKDQSMPEWPSPDNLMTALSTVLEMEASPIEQKNGYISGMMEMYINAADNDEEAGSFVRPDGWMLCTEQLTLLQRFVEYGLLDNQQVSSLLPNMSVPAVTVGESLMYRVASASRSHLAALAHLIIYAPGAVRSFAAEVMECLSACPGTPPPDGLLLNLASDPNLLAALCGYVNPCTILDMVKQHLLDIPDDAAARSEDPQGALTRFGEGVVFAEALVAVADVPLPKLLADARRSHNLAGLNDQQRLCVNGWSKALFGPDGIDDQILLTTSPPDLYRFSPSLIQQAILATAAGQIDLATLHSGLSYFSQSLLSWSLGGITSWLCTEIVRNGHLSGLHLNVLQNLVVSGTFPVALLRVSGPAIANLLLPSTGLGPVLQSSNYDIASVQAKLDELNILPNLDLINPLDGLRSEIQTIRTIDLAPESWAATLCRSMERAIRACHPSQVAQVVLEQILTPTSMLNGELDAFTAFSCFLLALRFSDGQETALRAFIDAAIPALFDADSVLLHAQVPLANLLMPVTSLCRALKATLLVASIQDRGVDRLVDHLVDELHHLRAKSSSVEDKKKSRRETPLNNQQRAVFQALISALGSDEELRDRWPRFGEMAASP